MMQNYESVTTWQAENWEVEVSLGSFLTAQAAAEFSN